MAEKNADNANQLLTEIVQNNASLDSIGQEKLVKLAEKFIEAHDTFSKRLVETAAGVSDVKKIIDVSADGTLHLTSAYLEASQNYSAAFEAISSLSKSFHQNVQKTVAINEKTHREMSIKTSEAFTTLTSSHNTQNVADDALQAGKPTKSLTSADVSPLFGDIADPVSSTTPEFLSA
jgi:hypothetical protein